MKHLIPFFLLALPLTLAAQVPGNVNYRSYNTIHQPTRPHTTYQNDSTFEIEASILMNQKADAYVAIFSLVQVGKELDSVNRQMDARIQQFTNELVARGINRQDVIIDMVSQVPIYSYEIQKKLFSKSAIEVPSGYELKQNVHVKYYRNAQLDDLLHAAAKFEIYDLAKVDYIVNNLDSLYDIMRKKAAEVIRKKTETYKTLGLTFSPMFQVVSEQNISYHPGERYRTYTALTRSNLNVVLSDFDVVKKADIPTSMYYDRIKDSNYDHVINAGLAEPAIQYSFNLKMRYVQKRQ